MANYLEGRVTNPILTLKMANYEEARVKQTNTQLKKLKSASKYKIETTL